MCEVSLVGAERIADVGSSSQEKNFVDIAFFMSAYLYFFSETFSFRLSWLFEEGRGWRDGKGS